MRNRRGAGLVDVMIALVLISGAGIVFSAAFPTGISGVRQGGDIKRATMLAQRKVEQVRSLGYENLSYENLHTAGFIDSDSSSGPYSFTSDAIAAGLTSPAGELKIDDEDTGLKKISVTVKWNSNGVQRSVVLQTLIAEKRPWRG